MRNWISRVLCGAAWCCLGVSGEAEACTNGLSGTVGSIPVPTSVFVPTVVSSAAAISIAAPVATHVSGLGVVTFPQAVVVPQTTTVQQLFVPQVFQQQVIRQRVHTTVVPRFGVRSLICR